MKALALLALFPGVAMAQVAPPVQDWSNVETVVVTAPKPGPALWHIAQNGSDVWILGVVTPMPRGLSWNSAAVEDSTNFGTPCRTHAAISRTPVEVSDRLFDGLRAHFDTPQLVGLTHVITPGNLRARFNIALDIGSSGFSGDRVCALPDDRA